MKKLLSYSTIFILISIIAIFAFKPVAKKELTKKQLEEIKKDSIAEVWAEKQLESLSLRQQIGQLFMVAAYSNKGKQHESEILKLIEKHEIGGLIFFQGGPLRQANLTNLYQSKSNIPLLISIDGEWGLAMRLDSTIAYPRQMALGAIKNNKLIYEMGNQIAQQCKRLGIHVNLAPVLDVNNNSKNPVINSRSFGEQKENVAHKGIAYINGLQDNGVMANGKHFPGHGNTDSDSHLTLPTVNSSKAQMDSLELYPFRQAIDSGLKSIMVAHLSVPALDSSKNIASTLSNKIVSDLLKNKMNYKGLVFTDALNMKGVSSYYPPGEVDVKALLAGNDVLLFSENVPLAIEKIEKAISDSLITKEEIRARCKKILKAKSYFGVDKSKKISLNKLYEDLNKEQYSALNRKLIESFITLVKNQNQLLPIKELDKQKIASVVLGTNRVAPFQKTLSLYHNVDLFAIPSLKEKSEQEKLAKYLKRYSTVIFSFHNTNQKVSKNYGLQKESVEFIESVAASNRSKIILNTFSNPYALNSFNTLNNIDVVMVSYQDDSLTQEVSAQMIFGGIKIKGALPMSTKFHKAGTGITIDSVIRFSYVKPYEFGIPKNKLDTIDRLVQSCIEDQVFPGCQILVAKEGKVFYRKSFGYHTYEEKIAVQNEHLYDIASITKIASSLPSIMRLTDEGKLNLDSALSNYIPEIVDTTAYANLYFREILTHQAGLVPWIPFYYQTLKRGGGPSSKYYQKQFSSKFDIRVAENMYINHSYMDTIFKKITATPLREKKYKYSDLGYYLAMATIQKITQMPLEQYVNKTFYSKLGLPTTTYRPREKFKIEKIVPTEYDIQFRRQLVHGDVHDPGAAMLGGVGGHAGLFSNANDLAKIMQMYLNWGEYGGERFLKEETVKEFSKCQYCDNNRRAVGFDKPASHGSPGPTCDCVSFDSFGHSGFTGTLTWADPDEKIVYVFLSNRVYPNANNKKLIRQNVRSRIMRLIYDSVQEGKENLSLVY